MPLVGPSKRDGLVWPTQFRVVTQEYNPPHHNGVDLRAYEGTEVYAAHGGEIMERDYGDLYGLHLRISGEHYESLYGHLSTTYVLPGEHVEAGQIIGLAGHTGDAQGAHLHFELRIDGQRVNPILYLDLGRYDG